RPGPVQVGIPQDREKPRLGPVRVAELAELGLSLAECLLGQVLRVRGRAAEPVGVTVQRLVMLLYEGGDAVPASSRTHVGTALRGHDPDGAGLFPIAVGIRGLSST